MKKAAAYGIMRTDTNIQTKEKREGALKMRIKDGEQIDADMQMGYTHSMSNETVLACKEWKKTWSAIVANIDSGGFNSIEDFDEVFPGLQSVYNWASDYEMALYDAISLDISHAKEMLSFCTEYYDRIANKDDLNSLNKRTAIADAYFRLGMTEEGEKEYRALTAEHPDWGWGWIGWSDEYSYEAEDKDYGRAIEILKDALKVDGIDEEEIILERLKDAYESCGMHDEANAIIIEV